LGSLVPLKSGDAEGHFVCAFAQFKDGGFQSSPKIRDRDHSPGERRSFNASLSNFSRGRESFEDVSDIVHPFVVRVT